MVKIALSLTAEVENIVELYTSPEYEWNLKLQCTNCNEVDDKWHAISPDEQVQGKGGPGSFNYQMKCKFCSNVSTIDVVRDSIKHLKSNDNDLMEKQPIVVFDCRGVEPVAFDPQSDWIAKSVGGYTFESVDFSEDENGDAWFGYDDTAKVSVSVTDLKSSFERV
ncbi:Eukaryotic protein of unknown function (DUF866) [Nesidiocoris tenuis]|uniref:DUF866 domain-containing protein n=1 Tax=Nesidiocoris tenuis TaxID=355587 RepID=A0ABN7ALG8_9HEMI|nr:Eukaryotic protein of unknown function (DUF866) [Nesidiocoris tenuis]